MALPSPREEPVRGPVAAPAKRTIANEPTARMASVRLAITERKTGRIRFLGRATNPK